MPYSRNLVCGTRIPFSSNYSSLRNDLLFTLSNGKARSLWSFSQTHKIGNIGIVCNFVLPYIYICSFLLYLQHMMLVNMKTDISGCKRITFQSYRLHWFSSFLIKQLNEVGKVALLYCGEFVKSPNKVFP